MTAPFRNIQCYDASIQLAEVVRFLSDNPDMMASLVSETLNRIDEKKVEGENVDGQRSMVQAMLWAVNRQEKICEITAEETEKEYQP